MKSDSTLLNKLYLERDLSIDREIVEKGRFKHAWRAFRGNMSQALMANVLFIVFLLPLVFLLIAMPPFMEKLITANMNFSGDLGFGFLGSSNDNIDGAVAIYKLRLILAGCAVPCMTIAGIGGAGAFYCARNLVWGTKIKAARHFFRGVKKYWWQFMLCFTIIGIEGAGIACSVIGMQMFNVMSGAAPWWIYFTLVIACIITFVTVVFMMIYLPMIPQYGIKERFKLKNSAILSLVTIISAALMIILLAIPTLLTITSITKIVFFMLMLMGGFMFYFIAVTEFSTFCSDTFVRQLYEYKIEKEERERKKQLNQERKAKNKSKKNNKRR